jgi:hypothetical protein
MVLRPLSGPRRLPIPKTLEQVMSKQDKINRSTKRKYESKCEEFYEKYQALCEEFGLRISQDVTENEIVLGDDYTSWYPPKE